MQLKILFLLILVSLVSITGTLIYFKKIETNMQEDQKKVENQEVYEEDSLLKGNQGFWTLNKDEEKKCPIGLNVLNDEILTMFLHEEGKEATGFLKKTENKDTYIFTNNLTSDKIEFKKLGSDLISINGCEFSRNKNQ